MGANWWDQVSLPLLTGVASQAVFAALCFLSVRLRNCFVKQLTPQTEVGGSAHDQPLHDGDAAAPPARATGVRDLEMGDGYGPGEGGQSTAESELEIGIGNGGEGIEDFSDQEARTRISSDRPQDPGHKRGSNRGVFVRPAEMDVPHSQQEEAAAE